MLLTILDYSVWIEYLKNNPRYFSRISKLLECGEILAVECVFGELIQNAKTRKEREIIQKYWKHLPKVNYENIIIEAGIYSAENKLYEHGIDLLEAIILMHGIISNSKIWTLDKNFLEIIPDELKYAE